MRAFTFLLALGLLGSTFAAPVAQPEANVAPALFAKDPLSIHRRSNIPVPEIAEEENVAESNVSTTTDVVEEPSEDSCVAICGIQKIDGAKSEREALCSTDGLKATLSCAQCIDSTWPDTTWEDSAMAEYERIVSACQGTSQRTFSRDTPASN